MVGNVYIGFTVKKASTCEAKDREGTELRPTDWSVLGSAARIKFVRWILSLISSLTGGNSGR